MALNLAKYGRKAMLDHMFGRIAHPFPTNRYLALFTADPTAEGTLTNEVAVGGYARVEISDLMGDADLALKQIANTFDIIFPPVSSAVSAITHMGVMDVATPSAGNMLFHGPLETPRTLAVGERFKIRVGQFTVECLFGIAKYGCKAWLDHVFGRATYTMPSPHLALLSDETTEAGGLAAELSGGGYARIAISSLMADAVLAGGQISNSSDIQFPNPSADWLPVVGYAVLDTATLDAGNMTYFGTLTSARLIYGGGDPFLIEPGNLVFVAR
jgi:hypothetical protein